MRRPGTRADRRRCRRTCLRTLWREGALRNSPAKRSSAVGDGIMEGLATWMIGAATQVTGFVSQEMQETTTPQLESSWYEAQFEPMADLGAALGLLVALIALASAAIRRSPEALAATLVGDRARRDRNRRRHRVDGDRAWHRRSGLERGRHRLAAYVLGDGRARLGHQGFGGFGSSALATLIALIEVFAAVFVWLELIVRNAAIYVAVLFFPVALAAAIWPALASWPGRLGRLLMLFVILKPVALIVLSLAGNAAAAGLSFGGGVLGVGRDDPRRDRDLRARGVRAVDADVSARGRRRERLHGPPVCARLPASRRRPDERRALGAHRRRAAQPRRPERCRRRRSAGGRPLRRRLAEVAVAAQGRPRRRWAPSCWRARRQAAAAPRGAADDGGRATGRWRCAARRPAAGSVAVRCRRSRSQAAGAPAAQDSQSTGRRQLAARGAAPELGGGRRVTRGASCAAVATAALAAGCHAERPPAPQAADAGSSAKPEHPRSRRRSSPSLRSSGGRVPRQPLDVARPLRALVAARRRSSPLQPARAAASRPRTAWTADRTRSEQVRRDELTGSRRIPAGGFLLGLRIPQLLGSRAGALALARLRVGGLGGARARTRGARCSRRACCWCRSTAARSSSGRRSRCGSCSAATGGRVRFHCAARPARASSSTLPEGALDPRSPEAPWSLPAELADLEFLEGELAQYEGARFGVVKDRRARTFTAALHVQRPRVRAARPRRSASSALRDYGAVLAALARDDSPVRRIGLGRADAPRRRRRAREPPARGQARGRVARTIRRRSWSPTCS